MVHGPPWPPPSYATGSVHGAAAADHRVREQGGDVRHGGAVLDRPGRHGRRLHRRRPPRALLSPSITVGLCARPPVALRLVPFVIVSPARPPSLAAAPPLSLSLSLLGFS